MSDAAQQPDAASPWHAGERAAQARVGVAERMAEVGRHVLRPYMTEQHRSFFARLPFVVVGSVDRAGWPWASMLVGPTGFAASPDPGHLSIAAAPAEGDPLAESLRPGAALGVLGIEPWTARRNRANGRVTVAGPGAFTIAVEQSFGNCPKYIHRRDLVARRPAGGGTVEPFTTPDDHARRLIAGADTFFVASSTADGRAVDVSHRGGPAGFVAVEPDGRLWVPDYSGNRFFNTLGNLVVNPRAGLLFVDLERGDLLQVAGETEILWEGVAAPAERAWRVTPAHGRWLRGAFPLRLA